MNILRKKYWLVFILLSTAVQLLAQEGRWYSLDDSTHSSPSKFKIIISLIIGLATCVGAIACVKNENSHSDSEKGCIIGFFIICMVIAIFCAFVLYNK